MKDELGYEINEKREFKKLWTELFVGRLLKKFYGISQRSEINLK
jgi:hypothetical protein